MCPHWEEGIIDIEIKQNKEEGMKEKKVKLSQEEYDRFLSEAQRYATYYGDPPAGYSGE